MKLTNDTPFEAGWTVGFEPSGREAVVVVAKATYRLRPLESATPVLAEVQEKPLEADVFGADPAADAPRYENDFAPLKPRCDVLVNARACAPGGRPARRVDVGVRVGKMEKTFTAVGPRVWTRGWWGTAASQPLEFTSQPISYDTAFGGTDVDQGSGRVECYLANPVGLGFCRFQQNLDGMRLPLTEETGSAITDSAGRYVPKALGPLGRSWKPRFEYAGTYDARWQETRLPFLPEDFDARYFQAAPADQTIPFPVGGEPIALLNLSPEGRIVSEVPRAKLWVSFVRRKGGVVEVAANLDTLVLEPDEDRMLVTWRAHHVLQRDPFELAELVVEQGDRRAGKRRARLTGKRYYPSLADLPLRGRR